MRLLIRRDFSLDSRGAIRMKRTRPFPLAIALALLLALPLAAQNGGSFKPSSLGQPAFRASVETITAAQLKDYLSFVASDEMEGRLTPSRGLDITARFMATLLARWGVKPAGDSGGLTLAWGFPF